MTDDGVRRRRREYALDFIRSCAVRCPPDEPLPSLRRMMAISGLGRVTLENALKGLIAQGMLRAEPRRGYFRNEVADHPAAPIRFIDIVACDETGYLNLFAFLNRGVAELLRLGVEAGFRVRLHRTPAMAPLREYRQLCRRFQMRHVFLVMPRSQDLVESFEESGCRCVLVYPRFPAPRTWAVCDHPGMMAMQLEYLFSCNHRRIGLLHEVFPDNSSFTHAWRLSEFYRIMAERGLRVRPGWVTSIRGDANDLARRIDQMLTDEPSPSALICHEGRLPDLYRILTAGGRIPGRDISIISDGDRCDAVRPHPTMIVNSPARAAEVAWELMRAALRGDEPAQRRTRLELKIGKSVAVLPRLD